MTPFGSQPITLVTSRSSTTSDRRSPLSYFETYACGLPSLAAGSTCVRLAS